MIRTLEHLAGWILFSLSILMVYSFLSLFLIGPTHARGAIPPPDPYGWIDDVFNTKEQPTFAQREYECLWTFCQSADDMECTSGECVGETTAGPVTGTIPLPRPRPYVSGLGPNPNYGHYNDAPLGVEKYVPNTRPRVPDAAFDSKDREYMQD